MATEVTARRLSLTTIVLGALVLVLLGLAVALRIAGQTGSGFAFAALPLVVLGLLIARRQPGNRIGLLLLGCSAVFALYGDATAYSVWDYHFHGGRLPLGPAAVVIAELWTAVFLVLPLVILLFPDGRPPPRWRRASGERRAQLKWLMAGSAATVIGLAWGTLLGTSNPLLNVLDTICLVVGIFSLPVCISFAILKYHLYDIDRLISRTVSYTLVTGILAGVYAGVVTFATRVLPFHTPVAVAASTLAVAALFNPLRRRVQHVIDRRFNRARYDADRTVAAFAARLKDEVDLDSIRDDLAGAVHQALEPAHVSVRVSRPADGGGCGLSRPGSA